MFVLHDKTRINRTPAMPRFGQGRFLHDYLQAWFLIPVLLWLGMWANLNTGFWNIIEEPRSLDEWQLLIRGALPYVVLPMSIVFLGLSKYKLPLSKPSPTALLLLYGCIAAFATILSPQPQLSIYWSVAFIAAVLCTWIIVKQGRPALSARLMLEATWVICFIATIILSYTGRASLMGGGESAYGIIGDLSGVSRSSGMARWAAIPGLVFLIRAFVSNGLKWRTLYICASSFCFFVVYRLQSRGALFGVMGALLFSLLFGRKFQRRFVVVLLWLAMVGMGYLGMRSSDGIGTYKHRVSAYLHRGQSEEEFESMTGRTRPYMHSLEVIRESPFIGMGQWTDRLHPKISEHVHNTILQAILNAGFLGFIPFIGSWLVGWLLFANLHKNVHMLSTIDERRLLEAGAVMAFFTIRAIPETTTASFAVDLMVMLAVYCYLEVISLSVLRPRMLFRRTALTGVL